MPIFIFISILLSGYVAATMKDEDKTRYFLTLGVIILILIVPRLLTGKL